jgi:hypothetical protein
MFSVQPYRDVFMMLRNPGSGTGGPENRQGKIKTLAPPIALTLIECWATMAKLLRAPRCMT